MEVTVHPTDLLRADHQNVLKKLNDLEQVLEALDQPDAVVSTLRELAAFFQRDIWAHCWKEEDVLFSEIKRQNSQKESLLGQMLADHGELRKANERLQRGVDSYLRNPSNGTVASQIREDGRHIIALLRGHFAKEDRLLFPAADVRLSQVQERQILDQFRTIERDMIWCLENLEAFHPCYHPAPRVVGNGH